MVCGTSDEAPSKCPQQTTKWCTILRLLANVGWSFLVMEKLFSRIDITSNKDGTRGVRNCGALEHQEGDEGDGPVVGPTEGRWLKR